MIIGTAKKQIPSGQAVGGWWRRAHASIVNAWLGFFVIILAWVLIAIVVGRTISRAFTQTRLDVTDAWTTYLADPLNSTMTSNSLIRATIDDFKANLHLTALGKFTIVFAIIGVIVFYVYNHIIRVSRKGRSYGDQLLGLYRVDNEGHFLTLRVAFFRGALLFVISLISQVLYLQSSSVLHSLGSALGLFTFVSVMWPLFDKHGQTIVEKFVGVYVTHPDRFGIALALGGDAIEDIIIFEDLSVGEIPSEESSVEEAPALNSSEDQ